MTTHPDALAFERMREYFAGKCEEQLRAWRKREISVPLPGDCAAAIRSTTFEEFRKANPVGGQNETPEQLAARLKEFADLVNAPSALGHVATDRCGFDRDASHNAGHYVCACGHEVNRVEDMDIPAMLRSSTAPARVPERILSIARAWAGDSDHGGIMARFIIELAEGKV